MTIAPNLQDLADDYLADRSTLPMALVQSICATYKRCHEEGALASDLRSHDRSNWRGLTREAAEEESHVHEAQYNVLCEMLGDQSRLVTLDFFIDREECGCPGVYATLDHDKFDTTVLVQERPWPTVCQNPKCPKG